MDGYSRLDTCCSYRRGVVLPPLTTNGSNEMPVWGSEATVTIDYGCMVVFTLAYAGRRNKFFGSNHIGLDHYGRKDFNSCARTKW